MPSTPALPVLSIPCRKAFLGPAVQFAQSVAAQAGFGASDAAMIALAVEETIVNVIDHGFGGECDETVTLRFSLEDGTFTVAASDKGIPFSQDAPPGYSPQTPDAPGLGTRLMRSAMDAVRFELQGREGRRTTLSKHLPQGRIDQLDDQELGPRGKDGMDAPTTGPRDVAVSIRAPRADEAMTVSRLAWRAYGYSYDEYIYHPESYNGRVDQGLLQPLVAVDDDTGRLAGHIALKRKTPDSTFPEMGVAFVDPDFRRCGIFERLSSACVDKVATDGCQGLYAHAVTSHPASQAGAGHFGLRPCALLPGFLPSGVTFKGITDAGGKESLLVMAKALDRTSRTVHVPARHAETIQTIYGWLELPRDVVVDAGAPGEGQSAIEAAVLPEEFASAVIEVRRAGADAAVEVHRLLREFRRERSNAVFLSLPLESPATPGLCTECEAMGFFLCGVVPFKLNGGDCLQMVALDAGVVDPARLAMHAPEAREMLDLVVALGRRTDAF